MLFLLPNQQCQSTEGVYLNCEEHIKTPLAAAAWGVCMAIPRSVTVEGVGKRLSDVDIVIEANARQRRQVFVYRRRRGLPGIITVNTSTSAHNCP